MNDSHHPPCLNMFTYFRVHWVSKMTFPNLKNSLPSQETPPKWDVTFLCLNSEQSYTNIKKFVSTGPAPLPHLGYITVLKYLPKSSACCRPACVSTPPCFKISRISSTFGGDPSPSPWGVDHTRGLSCTFLLIPAKWPPASRTLIIILNFSLISEN